MTLISLGTDAPDYLPRIVREHSIRLGHVKVGLWQGVQGARREAEVMPGLPVLVHGDNHLAGPGLLPQGDIDDLAALLDETRSRWFSVHLEYRTAEEFEALRATGYTAPDIPRDEAMERIVRRAEQLRRELPVPLLLENLPHWPAKTLDHAADTDFISEALLETGCDLLLDLSHSRVSGALLGLPDDEYLFRLPLGRVVEVHVSGPRPVNGILRDVHEPMAEEDYALLAWLLRRTHVEAVTLEYWKDADAHAQQLLWLMEIVEQAGPGS
jgi:uncharacterized protein (UPF0276 family)